MKRSQVKTTRKSVKQAKKSVPLKKIQDLEESSGDEVIEEKVAKKPVNKRVGKGKKVVVEEPQIEDSEVEEDTMEEDSNEGAESEEDEEENGKVEIEGDDNDDDDDDDDDGDDNGDEDNDDDADDNDEAEAGDDSEAESEAEAPLEKPIGKEKPTLPSKIKVGPVPRSVPSAKVLHISKLPRQCQQIDVVEAFAKYGSIDQVYIFPGGNAANVAFKSEKAAAAALAVDEMKINDTLVTVHMRREKNKIDNSESQKERTVYVKYVKAETTEEEIKEHFKECGEIERIILKKLKNPRQQSYGFIVFIDKSSVPAAVKLHNSLLNGVNLIVSSSYNKDVEFITPSDEHLSVLVRNIQNLESVDSAKLEAIFSKCGEIDKMQVLCRNGILAFITFKNEEAVEKAVKLSGTTKEEIELKVDVYKPHKNWTSIHVSNLSKDCTVEDLTKLFSKAGEIVSVSLKRGYANVRFTDSDGYCKSFLYNETFIKGHNIFIEPDSHRKRLAKKPFKHQGFKRSFENGNSAFKPKKAKTN